MNVPVEHMRPALEQWVQHGTPHPSMMGSFLRALLQHDIYAAILFAADEENRAAIVQWCLFLYNEVPGPAHGSKERLEAWHAHGGMHGIEHEPSVLNIRDLDELELEEVH